MSKKPTRRRAPRPAGTIIVVKPGNRIANPPTVTCNPGSPIAFIVFNLDAVAHTLWIDPDETVLKQKKNVRANPFAKAGKKVKVGAGDFGVIRQRIRPVAKFGRDALPMATYKYTISSGTRGKRVRRLDPDVDVTLPPAF